MLIDAKYGRMPCIELDTLWTPGRCRLNGNAFCTGDIEQSLNNMACAEIDDKILWLFQPFVQTVFLLAALLFWGGSQIDLILTILTVQREKLIMVMQHVLTEK